jgi:hypothetical protein
MAGELRETLKADRREKNRRALSPIPPTSGSARGE